MSTKTYLGSPSARQIEWIISHMTKVKYTAASGLVDWRGNINGELNHDSIPDIEQAETVDIGLWVTSIGDDAFRSCSGLTSVTIPDAVETIDNDAFTGCNNIKQAFFAGRTLAQVKVIPNADGNQQYSWGLAEDKIIPGIVEDTVLYTIAENPSIWRESTPEFDASTGKFTGFAEKSNAVKIIIPSKVNDLGVTSIGSYAFYNCSRLASIMIPNSVTSIGNYAFFNCSKLTSMTIPNGVTSIGDSAFYNCSRLASIMIPDSITSIRNRAFCYCISLTSVTIPDSVTSIGSQAFRNCSGLTSFIVGDGNASYKSVNGLLLSKDGKTLVAGINGDVTIPDSVTRIEEGAFSGCSGLMNVTIPDGVKSIGSTAFNGCSGLTSVTIPDSVTSIGASAFYYCSGLTSVTIGNSVTSIMSQAFSYCSRLTNVTIPDSVTNIGSYAFYYCSGLMSVTIGNGTTSIEDYAFYNCSGLTSVTFSGKRTDQVSGMANYSWRLNQGCVLYCSDGDIVL